MQWRISACLSTVGLGISSPSTSTELERHGFGLALSIDSSPRGTFGHVAPITTNQPLPFAADVQHGEIARAERRAFHWKAALLVLCEPARHHRKLAQPPTSARNARGSAERV